MWMRHCVHLTMAVHGDRVPAIKEPCDGCDLIVMAEFYLSKHHPWLLFLKGNGSVKCTVQHIEVGFLY